MHNNHLREAQYIKIDEKKKEQKQRIKVIQRVVSSVVVLFCVVSVSYTHLDVYKRQGYRFSFNGCCS